MCCLQSRFCVEVKQFQEWKKHLTPGDKFRRVLNGCDETTILTYVGKNKAKDKKGHILKIKSDTEIYPVIHLL